MKELNSLMTNTTSLVGYIAVLMIAGSYLGGSAAGIEPLAMRGSVIDSMGTIGRTSARSVLITIDGHTYRAELVEEVTPIERPTDARY